MFASTCRSAWNAVGARRVQLYSLRKFSPSASFTIGSQNHKLQHPADPTVATVESLIAANAPVEAATVMQEIVMELERNTPIPPPKETDPENWDFTSPDTYRHTTLPPHEAFTIHPVSYKSDRFFEIEKDRVFGKSWVCVGLVDEVRKPGDTLVAQLGDQPIFVVRDKQGELNGFLNVCRHRGSKLVKKAGRYPVISCPYHRWGYALDGRLLATPLWDTVEGGTKIDKKTGLAKEPKKKKQTLKEEMTEAHAKAVEEVVAAEEAAIASSNLKSHHPGCEQMKAIMEAYSTAHIKAFDKDDYSLFNVRVDSWGPYVFATLSEEIPSLLQSLGDVSTKLSSYPLHELVVVRSKTYSSKANWKLLVENFMEYYHLPTVHPALTTVSAVDNHHRRQGPGQYVGFVTNPLTVGGQPIDPGVLPPMPGLEGEDQVTAVFHQIFPNAFYFILPSHVFTIYVIPQATGYSLEKADLLIHPSLIDQYKESGKMDELNEKIDAIVKFYDEVNLEDIEACELVQDGLRSKAYQGGRVSFRFEETIHRFQNILIDHMVGKPGRVPKGDESIPFYIGGQSDEKARDSLVTVDHLQ